MRCLLASILTLVVLASSHGADPTPSFTAEQIALYEKEVLPLLKANCLKCHGDDPKKIKGGLILTSRTALLKGGDTGPAIEEKNPAESLLLKAIHYKDEAYQMPPAGKLADDKIAVLMKWVKAGAPYTATKDDSATQEQPGKGADKNYWAYKAVQKPTIPAVQNSAWVKTPIDAFILQKLEAKNLKPVTAADKVALARRAYYDLIGLPPTPEQVDAFVRDRSANAFEKLLDTLLASPQYGEKWGRHWLDVVRYGESNGYERDAMKPFAWRYRDYVIKSFNADKPYDQFIREQIAGDELPGDNKDAVIATGFYRLGLWDDEPADKPLALFDGYDDIVTVVGQGFLAMTLNCCRCHDHKGDFFPQTDYYRMVAFFREIRPFSFDMTVRSSSYSDISPADKRKVYETELKKRQDKIEALTSQMVAIEDAAIKKMPAEDQRASEGMDRPLVVKKVPEFLDDATKKEYESLRKQITAVKKKPTPSQEFALSVNQCDAKPPATNVLIRGNPGSKGKEVQPGFPEVFGVPDPKIPTTENGAKTSQRRTALANWLASKQNPLTARVMVNRVWQYHFGKGIVPTTNDFGKFGEKPSHPELLDFLADDFASNGWTLKRLHKLVMLSNTYQLSAKADETAMRVDPANTLHWRFDMRRLAAEEVRDTILMASQKLDTDLYGPSVYPKISQAVLDGQSVPGNGWLQSKGGGYDPANPDAGNRRSVYVHVKRSLQVPILATHDQADTDSSCPVRYTTTVPTQALGMLNGEFVNEQAALFAKRLQHEAPDDLEKQVTRAIRLTTTRVPTADEVAKDVAFVQAIQAKHKLNATTALTRFALMILNTNEFVYVD